MNIRYYFGPNIYDDNKRYETFAGKIFKPNMAMFNPADKQNAIPISIINPEAKLVIGDKCFWEKPILFDEIETPEIPALLLPEPLCNFASALAFASETPESLSVMTILGVISSVISRNYVVSPKDGWQETTNIYSIIGLPPANNKTLVLRSCTKPLSDWEKEQNDILGPQLKKERAEYRTQEKIIEALRNKAAKEKNPVEQKRLIQEITEKETSLISASTLLCLFITDATPEELAAKIYEQDGYLGIFSDEGGITEVLSGLYTGGSANIDILLKGIDGGDVKVRRKDKSFDLNPLLTIVLTVQPHVIQTMGEKRAYIGNGFLERFLYLLPKSKLGYRTHNTPPVPKEAAEKYHELIRNLLKATFFKQKETKEKTILTLSPEALADWKEFQQEVEHQLRPNGVFYTLQGWAGKICGFALRVAAILHVAQIKNDNNTVISKKIMLNALEIAALLTQHAIAAYSLIEADQSLQDAKELFRWVIEQNKTSLTQAEITFAMRNRKLGKKERLTPALKTLIERHILQSKIDNSTRKPTTYFLINPNLTPQE